MEYAQAELYSAFPSVCAQVSFSGMKREHIIQCIALFLE